MFEVSIGNSKCMKKIKFHSNVPMLKYCQESLNSCCFSSLSSSFASINQTNAVNAIEMLIKESLNSEVGNHIYFANSILKNESKLKLNKKCIIS